jgi:hypothetical protein
MPAILGAPFSLRSLPQFFGIRLTAPLGHSTPLGIVPIWTANVFALMADPDPEAQQDGSCGRS